MKADRRLEKTRQSIMDAFIELAAEKDYTTITVTELCRRADINRCTFYAHYEDIYQFIEETDRQMADQIISIFDSYNYDTDGHVNLSAFINYIVDNADKLFLLFDRRNAAGGLDRIFEHQKEAAIMRWREESYLGDAELKLAFTYMMQGTYSLIQEWYESGFQVDKEKIKTLLENIVKYGLYNLVYTK